MSKEQRRQSAKLTAPQGISEVVETESSLAGIGTLALARNRRGVATALSDIPMRRPPWREYPHCPHCHRRVVSCDPVWRLPRVAYAPTFKGTKCPRCAGELMP